MAKQHVVYITDRPPISAWPIILLIAVIFAFWKIFLAAAVVALLAACVWLFARWWGSQVDAQMRLNAALARRADDQHRAFVAGEEYRVHGAFPPATLG